MGSEMCIRDRSEGALDAAKRANQMWKSTLAEYESPPIDPGIDEALKDYIKRRKSEMPDVNY